MATNDNKGGWWNTIYQLFGFTLEHEDDTKNTANNYNRGVVPTNNLTASGQPLPYPTFTTPFNDDGAVVLQSNGWRSIGIDFDNLPRNEVEQITRYREMSQHAEVDAAIKDISNEAIVKDESGKSVDIIMDNLDVPDFIKDRIKEEFDNILHLFNFSKHAYDYFRRWYIDGRIYFHIIINETNPSEGISELRYIDPRKIRKVREVLKRYDPKTGLDLVQDIKEYFMYSERGLMGVPTNLGTKIAADSVIYIPSGLLDPKTNAVTSYLQKAVKPLNQLRMVEDAMVIYRIARAPERRVFYIDVGNMPTVKANQYVYDIMQKYKNKLVYDATTGEVKDDRRMHSMLEDFWLPRREGSKGTEISTLPGGENLGRIEDVEYFEKKLYKALDVPISRLQPQEGFSLGRSTEITRDELKFMKHVDGLRERFARLLDEALKTQLILKGVCSEADWELFREHIFYKFLRDNNFAELKDQELWRSRFEMIPLVDPYIGKYVSAEWIRKNILMMTDEDIMEMDEQIKQEQSNPLFVNPMLGLGGGPMGLGGGPMGLGDGAGMGGPQDQFRGGDDPFGDGGRDRPPSLGNLPNSLNAASLTQNGIQNYPSGNRFSNGSDGFIDAKPNVNKKIRTKKKLDRTVKN